MPPEVIAGRYRVEREIGRGGMGAVWLCRDELLGRTVAVKQIGRLPGESTTDLARAMREARSSAALNHRNVVSVFDAIEEDDHLWLVMEYVPGRTLAQLLAAEGPLEPARVAWIGAQVADGLAAAHARGTVHRDVKPGNVLLTEDDRALISDFGIARTHGDATLTRTGMVTGTPAYFAPELARGGDPKPASDVWALGATLYAAVEGHPPYVDTDNNALVMLSRIAPRVRPAPVRAGFLADALGRMLDRDPGSRWDMADAAHALHRLHEKYAEDGTREQTAPRPSPAPVLAAASLVDPDPDPTTADTPDPTPATPDPTPATPDPTPGPTPGPPPDRRRRGWALPAVLAVLVVVVLAAGLAWWASGNNDDPSGSAAPATGGDRQAVALGPLALRPLALRPLAERVVGDHAALPVCERLDNGASGAGRARDARVPALLLRGAARRHQRGLADALARLPQLDELRQLPGLLGQHRRGERRSRGPRRRRRGGRGPDLCRERRRHQQRDPPPVPAALRRLLGDHQRRGGRLARRPGAEPGSGSAGWSGRVRGLTTLTPRG